MSISSQTDTGTSRVAHGHPWCCVGFQTVRRLLKTDVFVIFRQRVELYGYLGNNCWICSTDIQIFICSKRASENISIKTVFEWNLGRHITRPRNFGITKSVLGFQKIENRNFSINFLTSWNHCMITLDKQTMKHESFSLKKIHTFLDSLGYSSIRRICFLWRHQKYLISHAMTCRVVYNLEAQIMFVEWHG